MPGNHDEPLSVPRLKSKWIASDDIYEILARQHAESRKLLEKLSMPSTQGDEEVRKRRKGGRKLIVELISRHEAESHTLYQRLKKFKNMRGLVDGLERECEALNAELTVLLNVNLEDAEWLAKLLEIKTTVERHMADEESRLFPAARKLLDGGEAKALGGEFTYLQDLRKNLMQPV